MKTQTARAQWLNDILRQAHQKHAGVSEVAKRLFGESTQATDRWTAELIVTYEGNMAQLEQEYIQLHRLPQLTHDPCPHCDGEGFFWPEA